MSPRHSTVRLIVILIALVAGVIAMRLPAQPLPGNAVTAGTAARGRGTEVVGAVHVHTTHSDGALDIAGVVEEGRAAGLDFLLVTDHNTLAAKPQEGYHGDLLLIVGTEISTDSGHVLAFGFDPPAYRFPRRALDVLRDIHDLDGVAIVAHPTSPRDGLAWTDPALPGAWGIEVLNGDTQWRAAGVPRMLLSGLLYPFNRQYALTRLMTRPAAARMWDDLLARRPTAGIVGADAHTRLPSYEAVFRVARNHVVLDAPLSGDGARDAAAIADALAEGRAFIGVDGIAPTGGFFFVAERGGRSWTVGHSVPPHPRLALRAGGVDHPEAQFHLLKDGEVIDSAAGGLDVKAGSAGVYRVEVTLPGWNVPWIMSNPIYVLEQGDRQRRAASVALPPPARAPAPGAWLERFEGEPLFVEDADPTSSITIAAEPRGGGGHGSAARITFRLGADGAGDPAPYAAIVNTAPGDLSAYEGLVLSLRADGVYRLALVLRDPNPRAPQDTEWWSAPLKTSAQWGQVAVPFSDLRTRHPRVSDGQLDLDDLEAVLLIIDTAAMPPGAAGTLWIDDVGLY